MHFLGFSKREGKVVWFCSNDFFFLLCSPLRLSWVCVFINVTSVSEGHALCQDVHSKTLSKEKQNRDLKQQHGQVEHLKANIQTEPAVTALASCHLSPLTVRSRLLCQGSNPGCQWALTEVHLVNRS